MHGSLSPTQAGRKLSIPRHERVVPAVECEYYACLECHFYNGLRDNKHTTVVIVFWGAKGPYISCQCVFPFRVEMVSVRPIFLFIKHVTSYVLNVVTMML